ncbi:unnamed protein product [Lota lota]
MITTACRFNTVKRDKVQDVTANARWDRGGLPILFAGGARVGLDQNGWYHGELCFRDDLKQPDEVVYAAVDHNQKKSARAAGLPDDNSECDYSIVLPSKPTAPDSNSETEDCADDYVLMQ